MQHRKHDLTIKPVAHMADGKKVAMQSRVTSRVHDGATTSSVSVCLPDGTAGTVGSVRLFDWDLACAKLDLYQEEYYMPSAPRGFRHIEAGRKVPQAKWWGAQSGDEWNLLCHPMTVMKPSRAARPTLVGFTTGSTFESYLLFNTRGRSIHLTAWCNLSRMALHAGQWVALEELMRFRGTDFNACVDRFAGYVAQKSGARVTKPTAVGWSDWQFYREDKCERDVLASLAVLSDLRRQGYPFKYLVVDGGWCDHASEWLEPCNKFPSGMKRLSHRLRRDGFELGLWLAPYLTNVRTKVVREHPDWLVLEAASNRPLRREQSNVGPCHMLDYTVPEALDWLAGIVRVLVRDWKIGYLKLDGPSLAHFYGGRFHDPAVTPLQVIRRSLEVIRRECVDGVVVEGEGIFGPSIGLVDTQRVSQDNHPCWYSPETGAASLKANLENELLASYMHNVYWRNHRENVILRDFLSPHHYGRALKPDLKDSMLTGNELQCYLSGAVLSGGAMLLTDPMDQLQRSLRRMELINRFLPHYESGRSRPVDTFRAGAQPAVYVMDIRRPFEEWQIVGVFNPDDLYADLDVPLRRIAGGDALHVFDCWNEEYLGVHRNTMVARDVPAHGCRLLALRRKRDVPQLVGTNMHILQGAVDIDDVAFENEVLRVAVSHPMRQERRLFIWHPRRYAGADVRTDAKSCLAESPKPQLLCIRFIGCKRTEFEIRWRPGRAARRLA